MYSHVLISPKHVLYVSVSMNRHIYALLLSDKGVQARFRDEQVIEKRGTTSQFQRQGDSGGMISYKFCPNCGSTVCWKMRYGIVQMRLYLVYRKLGCDN